MREERKVKKDFIVRTMEVDGKTEQRYLCTALPSGTGYIMSSKPDGTPIWVKAVPHNSLAITDED